MFRNVFINVCLPRAFQFECFFPSMYFAHAGSHKRKEKPNWLSLLQNNNEAVCICDTEEVEVNERLRQRGGKGGDMAQESQFTKSTVFVYAP